MFVLASRLSGDDDTLNVGGDGRSGDDADDPLRNRVGMKLPMPFPRRGRPGDDDADSGVAGGEGSVSLR